MRMGEQPKRAPDSRPGAFPAPTARAMRTPGATSPATPMPLSFAATGAATMAPASSTGETKAAVRTKAMIKSRTAAASATPTPGRPADRQPQQVSSPGATPGRPRADGLVVLAAYIQQALRSFDAGIAKDYHDIVEQLRRPNADAAYMRRWLRGLRSSAELLRSSHHEARRQRLPRCCVRTRGVSAATLTGRRPSNRMR